MGLKDIKVKIHYKSEEDDIVGSLIIPTLKEASIYNRGVGYFTIDAILNYAEGLIGLLDNGGEMNLIASPMLKESDVEVIKKGYEITESIVVERLIEQLKTFDSLIDKAKLDIISNLIAINKINIKIAFCPKGIYHEKIGTIEDIHGDYLAIDGSLNETYSAMYRNIESVSVFKSWIDGVNEYAVEIRDTFYGVWNNTRNNITVISFPDAVKQSFIEKYKTSKDIEIAIENYLRLKGEYVTTSTDDILRKNKSLYDYQEKAICEFVENGYRHFFEMATGTGKTFTAVSALKRLFNDLGKVFVVILVPQIDLQVQWLNELNEAGIENIYGIGGNIDSSNWEYDFDSSLIDFNAEDKPVIYVAIYDSFFSKLVNKISKIRKIAIVIDEAHNLSNNQINKLPVNASYRLGLSATPEKHNIEETERIIRYFIDNGKSTFKFTIEEAIERGFLSKYKYYPLFLELNDEEFVNYVNISKKIAILQNQEPKDYDSINKAMNERSLIVKKAENKISKLLELINDGYNFKNSVIYCGQGKLGDKDERMIDLVTRVMNENGKYCISTFTSETPDRKAVIDEFRRGFFDVLIAIRCFDEGVDVPQLDKIYIMSSDSLLRQTIQRRGRVLRKCKESGKTIAYIYDMVVLPPSGLEKMVSARALVRNEFIRVKEYLRLAINKEDFEKEIHDIEILYSIDEEDYYGNKELNR